MPDVRPTLKTIAEHFGVSAMTVSLALRNSPRISETKRHDIREHARKIGYQQNPFAASLVSLRTDKEPKYQANLALLNCYNSRDGWREYKTLCEFHAGALARARELGYLLEEFWLNDPEITVSRLRRILISRGIPGILLAFLPDRNEVQQRLRDFQFDGFACATIGWRFDNLDIYSASNDQYHTALLATEKMVELGYRRIGLILNEGLDASIEHRCRAGYTIGMMKVPQKERVAVFPDKGGLTRDAFLAWVRKQRLEAILAHPSGLHRWVIEAGMRIPRDIGFAYLDRKTPGDELAGIDQKSELVGSTAVDMVVAQLHRNERGIPRYQKSLLIRGEWVNAWSVRRIKR